jgi:RNA polymerase sigma-70 factor (ECF subfamily)
MAEERDQQQDRDPGRDGHVDCMVADLFRHQFGHLVARLLAIFGTRHLQLVEDVVQESLLRAVKLWRFQGVPDHPEAWLHRVARNLALDALRRDRCFADKRDHIGAQIDAQMPSTDSSAFGNELIDDQLALVFACCRPELSRSAQVALTLKVACGFSVDEIAAAFLQPRATVAQRLVRAKARLRQSDVLLGVPPPEQLKPRLDAVLEVLYLLFSEGYSASGGEQLIRQDLCREALRLIGILLSRADCALPVTHALAALMHLQSARLQQRLDSFGAAVPLHAQDRAEWDRQQLALGFRHLELARAGDQLTAYHLQAAIAGCHAAAPSFEAIDWPRIVQFYDLLLTRQPSPMVALNRAIAIAHAQGAEAGLSSLECIDDGGVRDHLLFHAARAELLERLHQSEAARHSWRDALRCGPRPAQRLHLEARLRALSR